MVGAGRFELPTSWSQTKRATAALRPEGIVERPRGDSNARHRLRRPVLYPLSYGGHHSTIAAAPKPNKVRRSLLGPYGYGTLDIGGHL